VVHDVWLALRLLWKDSGFSDHLELEVEERKGNGLSPEEAHYGGSFR
jgi:hypothetical protein